MNMCSISVPKFSRPSAVLAASGGDVVAQFGQGAGGRAG